MAEKRNKNRKIASIILIEGEDDDLLEWYLSFPKGERNQPAKSALRRGLQLPEPEPPIPVGLSGVYDEIDELRGAIEHIPKLINRLPASTSSGDGNLKTWVQEQMVHVVNELKRLERKIDGATSGSSITEQLIPESEPDKLDEVKLKKRQNRLSKSTW